MATNFPASLDSLTNPSSSDPLNNPSHSAQHANANDAIEALEAKVGIDGSANTSSLDYKVAQLESSRINKSLVDAVGDLIVGAADNTVARLGAGTNNALLVSDSSQTYGLRWATTLAGLTLTSPSIGTILNTGTLTLPSSTDTLVGRATTDTLTNKTLTAPVVTNVDLTGGVVDLLQEDWYVSATAATGAISFDVLTSASWFYSTASTGSWTLNVRGNSSTSLTSLMSVDDSITISFMVNCNNAAHYPTAFSIDGNSVTPKWLGGTAPSSGNASAFDVYTYMILKGASSFTVLASASRFG